MAAQLEAVRLNPSSFTYEYASYMYLHQGNIKEARAMIDHGSFSRERSLGVMDVVTLAFLDDDRAEMAEQAAHPWTNVPAGVREDMQGATAAYYGRLSSARDWTRRAIASAMSMQIRDQAAGYKSESALREALFGNFREARNEAKEASKLSTDSDIQGGAALALALSGDPAEAQKIAHDLNERFPEGYARSLLPSAGN